MAINHRFLELYNHVATLQTYPVLVEAHVCPKIKELTGQDEITFTAVELDPTISLGHIKQYRAPGIAPYAESRWITDIRYHDDAAVLNWCWRRFVCCKELMHLFDCADERANTREKFKTLMDELESPSKPEDESEMYKSETRTKWMALAILCPLPLRNYFFDKWVQKVMSDYEIALELRVPEVLIANIMSGYFFNTLKAWEATIAVRSQNGT